MRAASVLALAGATACDAGRPPAHGAAGAVVVAAPRALWSAVGDSVRAALEARPAAPRTERRFTLTHVDPADAAWRRLRRFRQVVVLGAAGDPWVRPALRAADEEAGRVASAADVWARDQRVEVVVVPRPAAAESALAAVPALRRRLEARFRARAVERMFASGADTALRGTLVERYGFGLTLPAAWYWGGTDSVLIFRNDWPSPERLVRSVLVTWTEAPVADAAALLALRDSLAGRHYAPAQRTLAGPLSAARRAGGALEIRGAWSARPGRRPAGGPFIARVVPCPEQGRSYLLDAWLYAPGEAKFEYVVQLETVLDSFECA